MCTQYLEGITMCEWVDRIIAKHTHTHTRERAFRIKFLAENVFQNCGFIKGESEQDGGDFIKVNSRKICTGGTQNQQVYNSKTNTVKKLCKKATRFKLQHAYTTLHSLPLFFLPRTI
jgi:hypothetical protein